LRFDSTQNLYISPPVFVSKSHVNNCQIMLALVLGEVSAFGSWAGAKERPQTMEQQMFSAV
jgi:hypothetical protein